MGASVVVRGVLILRLEAGPLADRYYYPVACLRDIHQQDCGAGGIGEAQEASDVATAG